MKRSLALLLCGLIAIGLFGCAPMGGVASMSVLTRNTPQNRTFQPVGERVEQSECFYWVLLFLGGSPRPNHETIVAKILESTDADVLLDAELTMSNYGFPLLFHMTCANVSGQPAKVAGGDA